MSKRIRGAEMLRLAAVLLLFVAAPTVGDIGSCGEEPADLDAPLFFKRKAEIDRAKCEECGFASLTCTFARDSTKTPKEFPKGCYPIVHDGEVCLRALQAASCETYSLFVADIGATTPTECNFCPLEDKP